MLRSSRIATPFKSRPRSSPRAASSRCRPTRCTAWRPIRFSADAVARLFAVKGRAAERALPLIAADVEQVAEPPRLAAADRRRAGRDVLAGSADAARRALQRRWRTASRAEPDASASACRRTPSRALCAGACRRPLTATSANLSGEPPTADPDEVERALGGRIDLLLDAGRAPAVSRRPSST